MVRSKVIAAVVTGCIALVGIAGCNSGSASPPSGSTTSPATSTAPKSEIANPLDPSKVASDVCTAFTDAQLAPYLGALTGKDPKTIDNGPLCTYRPQNPTGPTVGAAVVNIAAPTQDLLYQSQGNFPWRQKISPIGGYPAVNASTAQNPSDPAQGGDCSTDVAINDKQYIGVDFSATDTSDPNFTKPCTVSEALAAIMIQNIHAGGS